MNHIIIELEHIRNDIDGNVLGGYLENSAFGSVYLTDSPWADKHILRCDI